MATATDVPTHVTLASGHQMPAIGFGVYQSGPGEETYNAVLSALRLGYRHIDTAQYYRNEADVGRAVRDSGVPRDQIFVTTKIWPDNYGHEQCATSLRDSLSRMGLDYLDLLLLHSPGQPGAREGAWRALEEAVGQGLVRSIGVSNFGIPHLQKLKRTASIQPAVNQIEVTPFLQRRELVEYCKGEGIVVQAYSPLSKGAKLSDPRVVAIAQRLGVSPAQVMLRWSLQQGLVPLPKSVHPARQAANLDVWGCSLGADDMRELGALEEGLVTGWDPVASDPV